jgi:hypothetical protein
MELSTFLHRRWRFGRTGESLGIAMDWASAKVDGTLYELLFTVALSLLGGGFHELHARGIILGNYTLRICFAPRLEEQPSLVIWDPQGRGSTA